MAHLAYEQLLSNLQSPTAGTFLCLEKPARLYMFLHMTQLCLVFVMSPAAELLAKKPCI